MAFTILSYVAAQQASLVMGLLWITGVTLLVAIVAVVTWGVMCNQAARTPPVLEPTVSVLLEDGTRVNVPNPRSCCVPHRDKLDAADALHAGKLAQVDARLAGEGERFPKLLTPKQRLSRRTP
jgi:hypothetical protein